MAMWKKFDELFDHEDPASAMVWRRTVAQMIITLLLFAIVVGTAMTAGVPVAGRVIYQSELEEKVAEANLPLREAISTIEKKQDVNSAKLDNIMKLFYEQQAQNTAGQIRSQKLKRCRSIDPIERESIMREIDKLQDQYMAIKGSPYQVPACSEL